MLIRKDNQTHKKTLSGVDPLTKLLDPRVPVTGYTVTQLEIFFGSVSHPDSKGTLGPRW